MKMTYAALMKKIKNDDAAIEAWSDDNYGTAAIVTFFKSNGTSRRVTVEVTNIPADLS